MAHKRIRGYLPSSPGKLGGVVELRLFMIPHTLELCYMLGIALVRGFYFERR
jgi:hypothetical protein